MSIRNWFDTKDTDQFVKLMVNDLIERIPPPTAQVQKKMTSESLRNAHNAIYARVATYARTRHMNWFKKAYLGYAFRGALRELGYHDEFVDGWTQDLLVAVSTRTGTSGSPGMPP